MSNPQFRAPSFSREDLEHSHNVARRLRARIRSLSSLASSPGYADRAARLAREAVGVLEVRACFV
ncbi:MAG: hypothetical protein ACRD68_17990, partial [Pyrinomonadaceae bacterium]